MKKISVTYTLIILLLISWGCSKDENKIIGNWKSLNNPTRLIIEKSGFIDLLKDGQPFWSAVTESGSLSYKINNLENDSSYILTIMDGEDLFIKGKVEIITQEQIRLYYFKDDNSWELADAYIRIEE